MEAKLCKPRTSSPGAHVCGKDRNKTGVMLELSWAGSGRCLFPSIPTQCPSPSSWCAPGGAHGPAGSRGAGTRCRPAQAWQAPPARCSPPSWSHLHRENTAGGTTGPGTASNLPPSSLLRTFLTTLHTFWTTSAHSWTCLWAISTRNPGQGRALCIPLDAACAMKAFLPQAHWSARSWNASS